MHHVTVGGFVEEDTDIQVKPPWVAEDGTRVRWTLDLRTTQSTDSAAPVSTAAYAGLSLHFENVDELRRLRDAIDEALHREGLEP